MQTLKSLTPEAAASQLRERTVVPEQITGNVLRIVRELAPTIDTHNIGWLRPVNGAWYYSVPSGGEKHAITHMYTKEVYWMTAEACLLAINIWVMSSLNIALLHRTEGLDKADAKKVHKALGPLVVNINKLKLNYCYNRPGHPECTIIHRFID